MIREAEAHKAEDTKRKELVEEKNKAESMIYETEKNIDNMKNSLSEEDQNRLKDLCQELRQALHEDDITKIRTASENLNRESLQIFQAAYQKVISRLALSHVFAAASSGEVQPATRTRGTAISADRLSPCRCEELQRLFRIILSLKPKILKKLIFFEETR